jgi:hypothetical protein
MHERKYIYLDEKSFLYDIDRAILNSHIFRISKWMFSILSILIVIAFFGGSIYTSNKIDALSLIAENAKKEVSQKRDKTIQLISSEQEKFKNFIINNNYNLAKKKFDELIENVEKCSNDAIKYINIKKEEATKKLDVSNIKDLNNTKLEIKILEEKIKKLKNNKIISMEYYIYIALGISFLTFILFVFTLFKIKKR